MDEKEGRNLAEVRARKKASVFQKDWAKKFVQLTGMPIEEKPKISQVDFLFAIDTTGSMSDKIDGLLATCLAFADECQKCALSPQLSLVAFGDLTVPGDDIVVTVRAGTIEDFKRGLGTIPRYGGGGNEGESSLDAVLSATDVECRAGAVKMIVLITDEPPLQHGQVTAAGVTEKLIKNQYVAFVVSPPLGVYQDMAKRTGGKWYEISSSTDFSDLLDKFRNLAKRASNVAQTVHRIAGGSVSEYLRLAPPKE
jgi:hypothetical protein